MSLLANGCSFTEGYYLSNKQLSWPSCLGKMLDVDVCNLAVGGGSNDRIFRTSIQHLHLNQNIDFMVVGWTGISRVEIPLHNGSFLKITLNSKNALEDQSLQSNPPENYIKNFIDNFYKWHYNEFVWVRNLLCHIITLQTICEQKRIKLKQFFAYDRTIEKLISDHHALTELCEKSYEFFKLENLPFPKWEDRDRNIESIQNLIKQIDQESWIGWPTMTMQDSCKNFKFDSSGHPLEEGHQYWAEKIHDTLR
jgi:hypothetical protein